jgi:TetR/AcrR family tetracycline transcriptional repressor
MWRVIELTLRTLEDAGFAPREVARVFPILLHYTVGYVIEEQARTGIDYAGENPYEAERIRQSVDADRFPLTAGMIGDVFTADPDAEFEHGVRVILAGVQAMYEGQPETAGSSRSGKSLP